MYKQNFLIWMNLLYVTIPSIDSISLTQNFLFFDEESMWNKKNIIMKNYDKKPEAENIEAKTCLKKWSSVVFISFIS